MKKLTTTAILILWATLGFSQKLSIDFTLNIPTWEDTKPGIGGDLNMMIPTDKGTFEWTMVSVKRMNAETKEDITTGRDYYFAGTGINYHYHLSSSLNLMGVARFGMTEHPGHNFDGWIGAGLSGFNTESLPTKAAISFMYSPITKQGMVTLSLGVFK